VRPNLTFVKDVIEWVRLIEGPVTPAIADEDADFVSQAGDMLPEGELTGESWGVWTGALKEATGRKGKALFKPLRMALTGQERGPEMAEILPLIGAEKAKARLKGVTV
jgi:glutamyl-tRNA synthetase